MEIKLWENEIPYYNENADTPNSMTAYLTPTWQKVPAIVVLPGGAYSVRAAHEGEAIAQFYNSCGMHAFVVNYRLYPNKFPAPMADAQRAIKIIKQRADELAVDTSRIFVIGFSAGGHLAASVATMEDFSKIGDEYDEISPSVTGAILSYPVTSALPEDGEVTDCAARMTGGSREEMEKFTPYKRITENTPPCFIWQTFEDKTVDVSHSFNFASGLRANKIPCEMHIFPKGPHGLGLAKIYKDASMWGPLSVEWIKNNFVLQAEPK